MVENFFSTSNSDLLLHVIADANRVGSGRVDVTPSNQFIQASVIPLPKGFHAKPHAHIPRTNVGTGTSITQECWFVFKGSVSVQLFDENRDFLHEQSLTEGQFLITFAGAHSMQCLTNDTVLLEFKNGPYLGRDYQSFEYIAPS